MLMSFVLHHSNRRQYVTSCISLWRLKMEALCYADKSMTERTDDLSKVLIGDSMAVMTKQFTDRCATCQQMKTNTHPTAAPLMPIKSHAHWPFQQVTMDFITDLLMGNGFDSIFIVVDQGLSKGSFYALVTRQSMQKEQSNFTSTMYSFNSDYQT